MSKFHEGAKKAWASRRKKGWKRKSLQDERIELIRLAEKKQKKRLVKQLSHQYRSKARLRQVVEEAKEILYVDATISSEIEVTRDRVLNFMRVRAIWNPLGNKLKKFVLFDEADRLGYAAQGVLRSLLEKFPGTVTIYTTNRIEGVDPAIVSRASGGVFEFRKPNKDSLVSHMRKILAVEGKNLSHKTIQEIAVASASVREVVGKLQQEVMLESVKER